MAFNPGITGACLIGTAATVGGSLCVSEGDFDEFRRGNKNELEIWVRGKEPGRGYILSEDEDYKEKGGVKAYKDKYGGKHFKHFVGTTKKIINNSDGTQSETIVNDGWKGTYKENYRQDSEGGFSRKIVTGGEQLKSACRLALRGTLDTSSKLIKGEAKEHYKEKDVGRFCSPAGEVPVVIGDSGEYENGTIGANNKDKLASTRNNNDRYGEIKKNVFFFRVNSADGMPDYFKELRKKNIAFGEQPQALRDACEEAYKKKASDAGSPKEEDVLKYCALEESE